jgi:hypothetical protein
MSAPNLLRKRVTQRSIEGGEKSSTAAAAKEPGIEAWVAMALVDSACGDVGRCKRKRKRDGWQRVAPR